VVQRPTVGGGGRIYRGTHPPLAATRVATASLNAALQLGIRIPVFQIHFTEPAGRI